jgi:lysophospholipase L1-like esterase
MRKTGDLISRRRVLRGAGALTATAALLDLPGDRIARAAEGAGRVGVTNAQALDPFWAKVLSQPRRLRHVVVVGDSITAGFSSPQPWANGWAAFLGRHLKALGGDGGTVLAARVDEREGAPSTFWPGIVKTQGWTYTPSTVCQGLAGQSIRGAGETPAPLVALFPPFRYFDLIHIKQRGQGNTFRVAIDAQTWDVPTRDDRLAAPRYNALHVMDAGAVRERAVAISGLGGGVGFIEGARLRTGEPGIVDCNLSQSGLSLHYLDTVLTTTLARRQFAGATGFLPDLLVVALGQIDYGDYSATATGYKMARFLSAFRDLCPVLIVIYPPNVADDQIRARTAYHRTVASLATKSGASICVADCSQMAGWETVTAAYWNGFYRNDPVHPTLLGHRNWADQLFEAIRPR